MSVFLIPDYSWGGEGYYVAYVRKQSPAVTYGLRTGDIITTLGATEVLNIYDLIYALQDATEDEPVVITVRRGDQREGSSDDAGFPGGGAQQAAQYFFRAAGAL